MAPPSLYVLYIQPREPETQSMQTYSCFTVPLADGSLGLVIVFKGFQEHLEIESFMDELEAYLSPNELRTLH